MALAQEIAAHAMKMYQDKLLAVGLYGSLARATDGPYSDIEILCVLRSQGEDDSYEWSYGPWKAEVNFISEDVVLADAANVDERWSLTHGAFCHILPIYDPEDFFGKLPDLVLSQPEEKFTNIIKATIVGELYEWIGKLRNARHRGHTAYLPSLALDMARYGAFIIGLANRYHYSTGSRLLEESLTLPDRPPGYDALCRLAMTGNLHEPEQMAAACETFWRGIETWAAARSLQIDEPSKIPF
jgi:kanamycin nucleotidyltransferase